jgi:outer membrane cobalamin receptor
MLDRYRTRQRDGYEGVLSRSYPTDFDSWYVNALYEKSLGEHWLVTPGIRIKHDTPYRYNGPSEEDEFTPYDRASFKKRAYLNAQFDPGEKFNLSLGASYYQLTAHERVDGKSFYNGATRLDIDNASVFAQAIVKARPFNVTLGARYNYNSRFDAAFVPRIGLNKVRDLYHIKLLYSTAFRAPSVENINATGATIRPEFTTVVEAEAGIRITRDAYLTANLYDIGTRDVIVFYYENENEDSYRNADRTGTRGAELEFRWKSNWGFLSFMHAYYTTAGHSGVSEYGIPGISSLHLAFPAHKLNCSANIRISDQMNVSPSITGLSRRYGSRMNNITGVEEAVEFRPVAYADLALNVEHLLHDRIRITLAGMNLLNEPVDYIQPYNSNHAALPGPGRELRLRLTYKILTR